MGSEGHDSEGRAGRGLAEARGVEKEDGRGCGMSRTGV
jgi:hypothetical protein